MHETVLRCHMPISESYNVGGIGMGSCTSTQFCGLAVEPSERKSRALRRQPLCEVNDVCFPPSRMNSKPSSEALAEPALWLVMRCSKWRSSQGQLRFHKSSHANGLSKPRLLRGRRPHVPCFGCRADTPGHQRSELADSWNLSWCPRLISIFENMLP